MTLDTAYLLELAHAKSAEARRTLAATMAELFEGGLGALTERERSLMYDILHKLIRDAELSVRRLVARNLAERTDVPADLVETLANDEIEVAFPLLSESQVLRDEALIEIIRNRTLEHQLAIAIRSTVSERVSDSLVATGNNDVVRTLLENTDARISHATMEFLVEESRRVDTFQEPILRRDELDAHLAKRMFLWVSASMREYIAGRCKLSQAEVDDLLEKAALDGAAEAGGSGETASKSDALVASLDENAAVTPNLLIGALKDGQVRLFVSLFRRLCGLREQLTWRLLVEPGGEGLAIASRAVGVGEEHFVTIYSLTRQVRTPTARNPGRDTQRAREFYARVPDHAAKEVLRRWQRDVGYQAALRGLGLG